jgi:PTS system galactitol-specific IIA component
VSTPGGVDDALGRSSSRPAVDEGMTGTDVQRPSLFWSPALVRRFPGARDAAEAIGLVGGLLVDARAVTAEHVAATIAREEAHPTGLPAPIPFALVHTDEPGAMVAAAALGIFDQPVKFRQMDDPQIDLPIRLVVMLSVPERHSQAQVLAGLIATFADEERAARLLEAPEEEAARIVSEGSLP